jgi:hypothetical protein
MNYIIHADNYNPHCGGLIALHKLAHNLSLLGEQTYLTTNYKNPNWMGEIINDKLLDINNTVCIYPEITYGNPMNFKNVVRWILNEVGVLSGDSSTWGQNDLAFVYAEYFSGKESDRIVGELRAFDMNLDYWKNYNLDRDGECYIIRKGKNKILNKHSNNSINMDNYNNQTALELFNKCKRFICYDSECFLAVQAALCGCEVIVIPKDGIDENSWREKFPYFKYGIAYGENNINYVKETLHLVKNHMEYLENESIELTKNFIKICEKKFL